jgi:hypothetical protein
MALDINNETEVVKLANATTLGKEWGYYKRNIDK